MSQAQKGQKKTKVKLTNDIYAALYETLRLRVLVAD